MWIFTMVTNSLLIKISMDEGRNVINHGEHNPTGEKSTHMKDYYPSPFGIDQRGEDVTETGITKQ